MSELSTESVKLGGVRRMAWSVIGAAAVCLFLLALPRAAGAYTWTWAGGEIPDGFTIEAKFEGTFTFHQGVPYYPGNPGAFSCDATIGIEAKNTKGTQQAKINQFDLDASSCYGWGVYAGCVAEMSNNFSGGWNLTEEPYVSDPSITSPSGSVYIQNQYSQGSGGTCLVYRDAPTWANSSFVLNPTTNETGKITAITLEGLAMNGPKFFEFGPFTAVSEFEYGLGIE